MAIIKEQLVTELVVKQRSTIEFNVDAAKINPQIFKAQDMRIQPVLGSDFYHHLMQAKFNDTLTAKLIDQRSGYLFIESNFIPKGFDKAPSIIYGKN